MTVRIPKWLIVGAVALGTLATAFLLGRSTGKDGEPTRVGYEGRELPCSRAMAEKATLASDFDDTIRAHAVAQARLGGYPPSAGPDFFTDVATDYQVVLLRCRDVTGDGNEEMIVGVGAGASLRISSWAVFIAGKDGRWQLFFDREGARISSMELRGRSIIARTPTFGKDDPLCCPSGHKTTLVDYRDGEFEVSSARAAASEREIVIAEGRVIRLGSLDPLRDSPIQAVAELGAPTSIAGGSASVCSYAWADLGLSIDFANFGAGDACGVDGRIAFFELVGRTAAQAGWRTNEGVEVGMSLDALRRLYPGAREGDGELVLVETPSPIGAGGTVDVLTAFLGGGRAWAYQLYVGAAGE